MEGPEYLVTESVLQMKKKWTESNLYVSPGWLFRIGLMLVMPIWTLTVRSAQSFCSTSGRRLVRQAAMMSWRACSALLLAGLCMSQPTTLAFEGEQAWRLLGPFDADVRCLAVSSAQPDTLYGGRFRRVMRSTDGGKTWDWSEDGLGPHWPFIESLFVDFETPTILYAGTNRGVFRTEDGGIHWQLVSPEYRRFLVRLRLKGASPFYAIRGDSYELVESRDDCETWSPVRTFPDYCYLLIDDNDPTILYVGCQGALHLSRDGGATWQQVDPGGRFTVSVVAVHPKFPNVVYTWSQVGGLRRSQDGGVSWSAFARFPGSAVGGPWVSSVAFLEGKPWHILLGTTSGLYVGTDDGQHVRISEQPYLPGRRIADLAVAPNGHRVYAATDQGVFVSPSGVRMWSVSFLGYPAHDIYHLETFPSRPQTMLAITPGTLFRGSQGGQAWEKLSVDAHTFGVIPGPEARVIARSSPEGHIAVSSDIGETWKTLHGVKWLSRLWCRSGSLYGVFQDRDVNTSSFRRSRDAGKTWTDLGLNLSSFLVASVYVDPSDADRLYLGLRPSGLYTIRGGPDPSLAGRVLAIRVVRTFDDGKSWQDVPDSGKGRLVGDVPYARVVTGAATAGGPLYAGLGSDCRRASILCSVDSGRTWTVCGNQQDMGVVASLHVMSDHPERVIAGMHDGSVFWTADSGNSWQRLPATPDWGAVYGIVPEPQTGATLYLATSKGVFCGRNPVGPAALKRSRK